MFVEADRIRVAVGSYTLFVAVAGCNNLSIGAGCYCNTLVEVAGDMEPAVGYCNIPAVAEVCIPVAAVVCLLVVAPVSKA